MKAPACVNEVQRLIGRIAELSRFISKSAEKSLPFFNTLRKTKTFEWDPSCQRTFEELKNYLAGLPLLVKPSPGDTLYLYLSATPQAVSSVLIRENTCERCQKHSPLIHQPAEPLTTMLSPCPFTQWGIDIVGPFPITSGQRKFLLVAIDYFTKWIEAEPLACITEGEVMKFIWKNIIYRFGVPREIVSDNGRQFQGRRIQEWCQGLHIRQRFTIVAHPQSNGQVEVTNRILVQGIKGGWIE
ncbi:UNVERIFIED_CONTAM: hypothetical protein Slati_2439300 [Sesamum latifolium]|uniref:Integrase catalytic domain-containing protein n=1 Tax=Sesamum latifolium TaxID=2727402 RepID=A0AAW2WE19_9LAMI